MYPLQNDIFSWGLEQMSDHEILYNKDNYIQVVCNFKCTDHDIIRCGSRISPIYSMYRYIEPKVPLTGHEKAGGWGRSVNISDN